MGNEYLPSNSDLMKRSGIALPSKIGVENKVSLVKLDTFNQSNSLIGNNDMDNYNFKKDN